MAKVCSVVLNNVSRDARVLKEAQSLQEAGYFVTVIGLTDANVTAQREKLPSGVVVSRINTPAARAAAATIYRGLGRIAFLVTILALISVGFANFSLLFWSMIFGLSIAVCVFVVISLVRFRKNWKEIFKDDSDGDAARGSSIEAIRALRSVLKMSVVVVPMWIAVRRVNPDVLHCHDVSSLPLGLFAKIFTRYKVIYDAHEIYEEVAQGDINKAAGYRLIHKCAQRRIDAFITINESIAGWYKKNYPDLPPPVLIKNATPVSRAIKYDGRLHEAVNQKNGKKILLYQGGFATKRGLEYIVRTAGYLTDDWVLVMMGWGKSEPALRAIADEINEGRRIHCRPDAVVFIPPAPQKDLALWTAGATIGIIPYENVGLNHWFCTPNKLWEYPNAGVPVLVSPFPELSRPVLKYGYGWLLPDRQDEETLAEQIVALTDEQVAKARRNCPAFIRQDNWSVYEKRLLELYGGISGGMA